MKGTQGLEKPMQSSINSTAAYQSDGKAKEAETINHFTKENLKDENAKKEEEKTIEHKLAFEIYFPSFIFSTMLMVFFLGKV